MTALEGVQLFVCCHGSRDSRCGDIGVPLARRLQTVANNVGLAGVVDVYMCSHVGGHKVIPNASRERSSALSIGVAQQHTTNHLVTSPVHHAHSLRVVSIGSNRFPVASPDNTPPFAQYAGNVLVFGAHPCSGDWFGGLRADDSEAFIASLSEMECAAGASLTAAPVAPSSVSHRFAFASQDWERRWPERSLAAEVVARPHGHGKSGSAAVLRVRMPC